MKVLSSKSTVLCSRVIVISCLAILAAAIIAVVNSDYRSGENQVLVFAWLIATGFVYLLFGRLKEIELHDGYLLVKDRKQKQRIDFGEVEDISGSVLMNPEIVWIKLKRTSGYKGTLYFLAPLRFFTGLSVHPIVDELKEKILKKMKN